MCLVCISKIFLSLSIRVSRRSSPPSTHTSLTLNVVLVRSTGVSYPYFPWFEEYYGQRYRWRRRIRPRGKSARVSAGRAVAQLGCRDGIRGTKEWLQLCHPDR